MNVLLVTEPGENGVFRYVEGLAHYLVGRGVQVHLAYSDRRSGEQLPRLVEFVRRQGGATLNLATGNGPAWSDLRAFLALHRLARRVRPDVIHSHSSKAGVLARGLRLVRLPARQIYHPHAYSGQRPQGRVGRWLCNAVERVLGRWGTTVNTSPDENEFARECLHLPPGRARCVPNGVDTVRFRPAGPSEKIRLRRRLGLPVEALILGTLGRTCRQKDPLTLYRAFAQAAARRPGLVLAHVGCGELDGQLDRFVAEQELGGAVVRFPFLAQPEEFYRAIDGFILTSVYEGLSLAALEALACDLPLILSEAPGNRMLIALPLSHRHSAPVGDVGGFADAIGRWAALAADAWRASNHRRIALEQFDCRRSFQQVLELYGAPALPAEPPAGPARRGGATSRRRKRRGVAVTRRP